MDPDEIVLNDLATEDRRATYELSIAEKRAVLRELQHRHGPNFRAKLKGALTSDYMRAIWHQMKLSGRGIHKHHVVGSTRLRRVGRPPVSPRENE